MDKYYKVCLDVFMPVKCLECGEVKESVRSLSKHLRDSPHRSQHPRGIQPHAPHEQRVTWSRRIDCASRRARSLVAMPDCVCAAVEISGETGGWVTRHPRWQAAGS